MFDKIEQARLSELHFRCDPESQLRAIIAIHSTHLGPALGGCRFIEYDNDETALEDVIRLARGMSYKAALANIPQGGGKSVILKPKNLINREKLFESFGEFVNHLGGRYITAMDSGSTLEDMSIIGSKTPYVVGTKESGGDPSPMTALGVLEGIRSCVKLTHAQDTLKGIHVAIQGVGHVGFNLANLLHQEDARLTVSDVNPDQLDRASHEFGAAIIKPNAIYGVDCDVFAPCGLGGIINGTTIPQLRCKAIAGSANNQLLNESHARALEERGIIYAPDYVINAGGLIHVSLYRPNLPNHIIKNKVLAIGETVSDILTRAQEENLPSNAVANIIAEERLQPCKQKGMEVAI